MMGMFTSYDDKFESMKEHQVDELKKRIKELKKTLAESCEDNRQNWNQELRGSAPCPIGEKITEQEARIEELEAEREKLYDKRIELNGIIGRREQRIEELESAMRQAQNETGTSTSTWHVLENALKSKGEK